MLHYYITYLLMLFSVYIFSRSTTTVNVNKNRNYCIAFFLLWTILLGLRHPSMGDDIAYGKTFGYWASYKYIAKYSLRETFILHLKNYEQGYIVFNKLLSYISEDPQFLLFSCAVICIGAISIWLHRNSKHVFLSSIIFLGLPVFLILYSGLRQALAVAITLFSFEFIKQKKFLFFLFCTLLARLFHSSAILFLLAYPLYYLKMNKSVSALTVLLPPVIYLLRYPLFTLLSQLLKNNAVPDNNNAIALFLVFWAVYFFAVLFGHEEDQNELGLRNIFFFACCCQAFGGVYGTAMRVGYYFMPALALLLPKIIVNNAASETTTFADRRSSFIMYLVIFVCFAVFGLYSIANSSWAQSNPHSFYWQPYLIS